jgi:hypothetical protein
MQGHLPNLIVIGAMKSGTTSLHNYLAKHPDIFMSTPKEVDFFAGVNENRGLDWYKSLFPTDHKIRGESSQNYSKGHNPLYEHAPGNIAKVIPNVKLIYLVRDPVERYRSHILENAYGENPKSVADNIKIDSYVRTGLYHYQLSFFLEHFDLSQIRVVPLEKLKTNRLDVMNDIFRWLGVEEVEDPETFDFISNHYESKLIPYAMRANFCFRALNKFCPRLAEAFGNSRSIQRTFNALPVKVNLDVENENRLMDLFRSDTEQLRQLTGLPFSEWSV